MQKTVEQNLRLLKNKLFLIIFLAPFILFGQNNQIKFKNISIGDGLSQSEVTAILQDHKGLMWFGTQDGLNRFDGFEFTVFYHDITDKTSISNSYIRVIYEDLDSNLWIGTENGLNYFDRAKQKFIHSSLKKKNGNFPNSIWTITEDKNNLWVGGDKGVFLINKKTHKTTVFHKEDKRLKNVRKIVLYQNKVFIATEKNGLFIDYNGELVNYTPQNSLLKGNVVWDVQPYNNQIIIATQNGLNILNNDSIDLFYITHPLLNDATIKDIFVDKSNVLWFASENFGIFKVTDDNEVYNYQHDGSVLASLSSNKVNTIYEDDFGIVWIGNQNGIDRFDKYKQFFKHVKYTPGNPNNIISSNLIWSIYDDEINQIYVGTDKGLDIYNSTGKQHLNLKIGQNKNINNTIFSIFKDRKNEIWLGTEYGLYQLKNNQLKKVNHPLNINRTYKVFEDNDGRLWIGTREGLIVISNDRKNWKKYTTQNGLTNNIVRTIIQDYERNVWLGTDGGGLIQAKWKPDTIIFNSYVNIPENLNSISSNSILSILPDKDGSLWIGTFGGGLNHFNVNEQKFTWYTIKNGLSNNVVYSVLEGKEDELWMSTNKGISLFNKKTKQFKNFFEEDGLQSNEFNTGAYFKNKKGDLYFGGINGFNYFNPNDVKINTTKPKPILTNLYMDNKPVSIGTKNGINKHISELKTLVLNPRQNVFTIEFAALHYSSSKQNQHAYMLENFNDDWIYVGSERRANYTNLDPGEYTFKLKVANSDGIWSDEILQLKIIVEPPFYKTWWARLLAIFIVLGIVYLYYITRITRIKAQKQLLEIQVRERTQEVMIQKEEIEKQKKLLEEEKEKTEQLLLNTLPPPIVKELKTKGKTRPRQYRQVTIMFTDIKGFTKIAEEMEPQELVSQLDECFVNFDRIIEKYNVEKIKTIGDAYMCAGGIPVRNKSNPIDVVLAALEIQRFMKKFNQKQKDNGQKPWGLRIGIHTGELIAGVVGTKRFAYDIWGDSVNIASRMESSSDTGKINVSGATYEMVKEFFVCEYRGKVAAKNKGEIDMYYISGIKPELSVNENQTEPNDLFWSYVNLHLYSSINYRRAEKFILKQLEDNLPANLHYHSIQHTKDVCAAVERLALMERIEGDDIFLLKTAALYHDAGFIKQYAQNEIFGAEMARKVLPKFGYTEKQIDKICELIMATRVPQQPKNHLEEIICDADLDYLGRDDFHPIAEKLKKELMERNFIKTDKEWDELQIKFLEAHRYFTKSAIRLRREKKMKYVEEIKERLKTYE